MMEKAFKKASRNLRHARANLSIAIAAAKDQDTTRDAALAFALQHLFEAQSLLQVARLAEEGNK